MALLNLGDLLSSTLERVTGTLDTVTSVVLGDDDDPGLIGTVTGVVDEVIPVALDTVTGTFDTVTGIGDDLLPDLLDTVTGTLDTATGILDGVLG
ncbi:MAG: hypothetical protein GEU95_26225 [Rhizobiales bacterium]|nr:hypothetical protein [Hyphomicrobiales bacterium]